MMIVFLLFFLQLILLFFISGFLTGSLSQFLLRITKSRQTTVNILSFLFLPGIVVHELSHLLAANILMVRTGEVELVPKITGSRHEKVKLGSVEVARTDPFRRFIIGVAPVFVGLFFVLSISYFILNGLPLSSGIVQSDILVKSILFYLLFVITLTMFSSEKDMEGALGLFLTVSLILLLSYLAGVRIPFGFVLKGLSSSVVRDFLKRQDLLLAIPLFTDLIFTGLIRAADLLVAASKR